MSARVIEKRIHVDLEGDTVILFDALTALLRKRELEQQRLPATRSEVVGAIITAFVLSHEDDIMEAITDEAERIVFSQALRSRGLRSGLPRPHRTGSDLAPQAPDVSDSARDPGTPGGDDAASIDAAERDQAAE